jgi:hypothetical protein
MGKYCIIKHINSINGTKVPVIILDSLGEVLEFEELQEAEDLKDLFQKNSDSGYTYIVKKI